MPKRTSNENKYTQNSYDAETIYPEISKAGDVCKSRNCHSKALASIENILAKFGLRICKTILQKDQVNALCQTLDPSLVFNQLAPPWERDFAPRPKTVEYMDGITRSEFERNRWQKHRDFGRYPQRYRDYLYQPSINEVLREMKDHFWEVPAFQALRLLCPTDIRDWLDYCFVIERDQLHLYNRHRNDLTIAAYRNAAARWRARSAQGPDNPDDGEGPPNPGLNPRM